MDGVMLVVGLAVGVVLTVVLYPIARSRGRSGWWALLGMAGLIGFGVAIAVLYIGKPGVGNASDELRGMYARGEIGEEEYRRAMTGIDRAA